MSVEVAMNVVSDRNNFSGPKFYFTGIFVASAATCAKSPRFQKFNPQVSDKNLHSVFERSVRDQRTHSQPGSYINRRHFRRLGRFGLLSVAFAIIALSSKDVLAGAVNATFLDGSKAPIVSNGFNALGKTLNVNLNFAPSPGTELTVVRNTGPELIHGTFTNLAQGQTISLTYAGLTFKFVANYHGGRGNDLVLLWTTDENLSVASLTKLDPQLLLALKQSRGLAPFDKQTSLQPAIPVKDGDRVLVDVEGSISNGLLDEITRAGGQVVDGFVTAASARAMVPVAQLETLAARDDVSQISATKLSIKSRIKVR
jgi:hypothetical protein